MRFLVALLLTLSLIACAPRGEFMRLDELSEEKAALAPQLGIRETIFVGTSRQKDEDGDYGFLRAGAPSFLRYDVFVPFDREPGQLKWPKTPARANPQTDFLTLADREFEDPAEFRKDLRSAMDRRDQRDIVIYVHGYNNTLAESVYRVAQMHSDLKVPGVAVHYAWPSRGSALGYVYDRDSALFGRDGLEDLMQQVADAGAQRILIVAHSMGSVVAMETLRQTAIRGRRGVMERIGGVVLISPDLDVDLFHSQAAAIGRLPQPFLIFGSSRDSVLGLSSRLAGRLDRLGNLKDLAPLADLEVVYLDTAAYNQGSGHFNLGTSPALLQLLGGIANIDAAFRAEGDARVGLLPGVVLTMRRATEIVLTPVEVLAEGD
ncbi:alpha/beta hydrolase [Pseudogemmobacter sonorensis]|uniref:alpha/beta hydrolase n=1 Tax=Pseudogemmobacter sonorensis TaxID=2989681 RepID=UPI0036B2C4F5